MASLFGMGRQQRRQHRAFFELGGFAGRGSAHLQHDIGIGSGAAASGAMVAPAAA